MYHIYQYHILLCKFQKLFYCVFFRKKPVSLTGNVTKLLRRILKTAHTSVIHWSRMTNGVPILNSSHEYLHINSSPSYNVLILCATHFCTSNFLLSFLCWLNFYVWIIKYKTWSKINKCKWSPLTSRGTPFVIRLQWITDVCAVFRILLKSFVTFQVLL
jgi:hypothetical protein